MKTSAAHFIPEAELVVACRQGNPRAQRLLYDRMAPKMLGVCLRYLRNYDDAEEAMMTGFAKAFRALEQFRSEGSFEGWVRRIMVREALNQISRREPFMLNLDDCPAQYTPALPAGIESELNAADLLALIQELPAGYRTVFNLAALEGYTHQEIAELLGISEGTSKSQLSKARALLQRRLTALTYSSPASHSDSPCCLAI